MCISKVASMKSDEIQIAYKEMDEYSEQEARGHEYE